MTGTILSEELYFRYLNTLERESRFHIDSFRSDGEPQWTTKFGQARIHPSQVRVLFRCCGANNWKDDDRFANECCCDSCGQFVEALQHNDRRFASRNRA